MENIQWKIVEFDGSTANDELIEMFIDFNIITMHEIDPDDPGPTRDVLKKFIRDKHPHYHKYSWIIIDKNNNQIIAVADLSYVSDKHPAYDKNKHIANISISILAEYRRKGIGTKLLKTTITKAQENNSITTVFSGATRPSGINFMKKLNGKLSQTGGENRLRVEDINWSLIDEWIEAGKKRSEEEKVKIEFFENCPEEIIDEYCKLYSETMMQQPLGDYDGDIKTTPESRRLSEKRQEEKGMKWFTMITREPNEDISGLTEIFYHPEGMPHRGMQNLTGVKDTYRNRDLGKWLKAEMLKWFLTTYPDVKYISTGNDSTNAAMLSINTRMGFKEFLKYESYKFGIQQLVELLE
jgi:RimJ/RimL family protein N-acetyltransferase